MIKGDRGSLWWGDIVFAWNRLWVCACAAVQCCHIYEIILFRLVLNVEKSIKSLKNLREHIPLPFRAVEKNNYQFPRIFQAQ